MRLRTFLFAGIALASPALAQRNDFAVDQVSPPSSVAIQQLEATQRSANAGVASRPLPQLDRSAVRPAAPNQLTSTGAGRDPSLGQKAPRGTEAPTTQLARPGTNPRLSALPPGLVDACDAAAAGKGAPPPGVDCKTLVQAAPPPRIVSAEEALLSNSDERDAQRLAAERLSRGQTVDAAEVARRLSIGDLRNSPVAQAVAAQAAAEAAAQQALPSGARVIVPGGGTTVVQPNGN